MIYPGEPNLSIFIPGGMFHCSCCYTCFDDLSLLKDHQSGAHLPFNTQRLPGHCTLLHKANIRYMAKTMSVSFHLSNESFTFHGLEEALQFITYSGLGTAFVPFDGTDTPLSQDILKEFRCRLSTECPAGFVVQRHHECGCSPVKRNTTLECTRVQQSIILMGCLKHEHDKPGK